MNLRNRGTMPLSEKALLDAASLAAYLDVGETLARQIGKRAEAEVRLGRAVRYKREKIDVFLSYL